MTTKQKQKLRWSTPLSLSSRALNSYRRKHANKWITRVRLISSQRDVSFVAIQSPQQKRMWVTNTGRKRRIVSLPFALLGKTRVVPNSASWKSLPRVVEWLKLATIHKYNPRSRHYQAFSYFLPVFVHSGNAFSTLRRSQGSVVLVHWFFLLRPKLEHKSQESFRARIDQNQEWKWRGKILST
jgi:hypothetical protein